MMDLRKKLGEIYKFKNLNEIIQRILILTPDKVTE
jgi:hypothetical protein